MPRYELVDRTSRKFWEVGLSGTSLTASWGKIGGSTSSRTREFPTAAAAQKEHDKLVAEKVGKGYALVGGKAAKAAAKLAGKATGPATNADLEAAILADPDDADAYLVYADWLQGQGDPRGELAVLQHRATTGKESARKDANAAAKALLRKHAAHFLGKFAKKKPEKFELEWSCGFIKSAKLGWPAFAGDLEDEGDDEDDRDDHYRDLLVSFLRLPSARFIQDLELGPVPGDEECALDPLAEAIDIVAPPCLRALDLSDTGHWDISSTSTAKPDSKAIKGLRSLVLTGGSISLGTIDLPELRSARFVTGGMSRAEIKKIATAKWPKLERLEIWFGDPNYGGNCDLKSIAPILAATGLPAVRHLGLRNCAFADAIAKALPKSAILRQLETLDLSMGNLSDRGLAAMAASKDAFQHLVHLDLGDNALGDGAKALVKGLAKKVDLGKRQSIERAVPRGPDNKYSRYVAVGE